MMRRLSKLFSAFLALVLVIGLGTQAKAEDVTQPAGPATITVKNAVKDQEYTWYRVFDASPKDKKSVAYTATDAQVTLYNAQTDNPFDFEKNTYGTNNVSVKEGKTEEDVINFLYTLIRDEVTTEVTDDEGNVSEVVTYVPNVKNEAFLGQAAAAVKANGTNPVVFSGLEYGYYLVTTTLGAKVTVDTTAPDAVIIDKNDKKPGWEPDPEDPDNPDPDNPEGGKKIVSVNGEAIAATDDMSTNINDELGFRIAVDAKNYDGTKEVIRYEINDKIDGGFAYGGDLKVQLIGADGVAKDAVLGNDYTVQWYMGTTAAAGPANADNFVISLEWKDKDEHGSYLNGTFKHDMETKIVVTYTAALKNIDDITIAGEGNKNTAGFKYYTMDPDKDPDPDNPDPDNPDPTPDPETITITKSTTTYTYALAVMKVDAYGAALAEAEFEFALGDEKVSAAYDEEKGYYIVGADASSTTLVSQENGQILVVGVKEGTYTVTETKAPAGYKLMAANEVQSLVAQKIGEEKTEEIKTITIYRDANDKVVDRLESVESHWIPVTFEKPAFSTVIVNEKGTNLPATGGMGTTIFYVAGGTLVAAAAFFFIRRKAAE